MELTHAAPSNAMTAAILIGVSISGAAPAAAEQRTGIECTRRAVHAPAAQTALRPDPDDVFADDNDDFVWIDLERMLAGREAARRLHPSFTG